MFWAIDLGTTNSVVAVCEEGSARVVRLPELGRALPSEQPELVPSALHVTAGRRRWWRLPWLPLKPDVAIGQQALARNYDGRSPGFAQAFKPHLARQPHRPVLRAGERDLSAREAAFYFLRELLRALAREQGARIRDLTIPAPVGCYEPYRAELQSLERRLGLRRFRSLDEPVAAALGYGIGLSRDENLLVVDFGGGTLDLAVARVGPEALRSGAAPVLAKHMVALGGGDVDRWLAEHLVPGSRDLPEWRHDLLWEAMWLKQRISLLPPESETAEELRWGGLRKPMTRRHLEELLAERGLYRELRDALAEVRRQLEEEAEPGTPAGVDEVLLVGGSTLLPGVPAAVDDAFPGAVVRHDPEFVFTAVALGAARFAGGAAVDDFIYHDYALAVQDEGGQGVEYELLVPRRTRYPTSTEFAVRYYADYPGMTDVRLSVCEVGRLGRAPVRWEERPNGNRYWAPAEARERAVLVELNPTDTPLPLRPAGRGTSPRLRVTYTINADRWLCTTVEDLVRKQALLVNEPVVRLR